MNSKDFKKEYCRALWVQYSDISKKHWEYEGAMKHYKNKNNEYYEKWRAHYEISTYLLDALTEKAAEVVGSDEDIWDKVYNQFSIKWGKSQER